jgi:hypothetical protein
MTTEDMLSKMLTEIKARSILPTEGYTPTLDHYVPLRFMRHYLELAKAVGFDEGRKQNAHGKAVIQLQNGVAIKTWPSQWDAEKHFKLSKGAIGKAIDKPIKVKGFEWKRE